MVNKSQEHRHQQQSYFVESIDCFQEDNTRDIRQRISDIAASAQLTRQDRILDVNTGIGVLIPYFQHYQVTEIVGCDPCETMLNIAREKYPDATFWCGEFRDFPAELGLFDSIFFNAMFGSVCDQYRALEKAVTLLNKNGRIVISHPMGATFADELQYQDPETVLHPLPDEYRLAQIIESLPLNIQSFLSEEDLYVSVLQLSDIEN